MRCAVDRALAVAVVVAAAACLTSTGAAADSAAMVARVTAGPADGNYCAWLEQENAGLKAPLLAGSRGTFYVGGQDHPGGGSQGVMPVIENETLGFTHAFSHDGRARGEGIVTDELTGTGHSMWGWERWRIARSAYGTLSLTAANGTVITIPYPSPESLKWRPDRLTAQYAPAPGVYVTEVKWVSQDDVLLDTVALRVDDASEFVAAVLTLDGSSYVNTQDIPTFDGDPPNLPTSQARDSTCDFDAAANAVHVAEKGTAYAKTTYCTGTPQRYMDLCRAKVGPMMYDGMHVVLSADAPLQGVSIARDSERRQLYNFSVALPLDNSGNVTLAWVMDDDEATAKARAKTALASPASELVAVTTAMNTFLREQVPAFSSPDDRINQLYYYGWALYNVYMLNVSAGFEALPHTQTAVNNFLGLHAYDSRVYVPMGSWVSDLPGYAYGNVLTWNGTLTYQKAWNGTMLAGTTGDNIGHTWVSPTNCSAISGHPEGAWQVYQHGADKEAFLQPAYALYAALWGPGTGAQIIPLGGIATNSLDALSKMATALGRPPSEVAFWDQARDSSIQYGNLKPPPDMGDGWTCSAGLQATMAYWVNDSWAHDMGVYNGMNKTGCWQNGTIPLRIMAGADPNFEVSTIVTYWAIEGLFRHNFGSGAVELALAHMEAMLGSEPGQKEPWIVMPEAWDIDGEPWGDQFYNWDGVVNLLLLERLAGVSYSVLDAESVFTVRDWLPAAWDSVNVSVPVRAGGVPSPAVWVDVSVARAANGRGKTVTVNNNPLRSLKLELWLEGHTLKSAQPAGYDTAEHDRVRWSVGGKGATVSINW